MVVFLILNLSSIFNSQFIPCVFISSNLIIDYLFFAESFAHRHQYLMFNDALKIMSMV